MQVSLLLSISLVSSVNYQEEYEKGRNYGLPNGALRINRNHENIEGAADSSGFAEGSEKDERPDFSKYFSGGGHSPISAGAASSGESSASGFVAPVDFGQFFSGSLFGKKHFNLDILQNI